MTKIDFLELVVTRITPNEIFANLRGDGTTKILSCENNKIKYKRKRSILYLSIEELWAVYEEFKGKKVSSSDLKNYKPYIFSSNYKGHSCHCTTLFLIFKVLDVVNNISGKGIKGNPFSIEIIK